MSQQEPARVICARDVNVSYGNRHIVRNVSFDIHSGEFVGLLGANGAGKTTLFRAIMGLIGHTGTITVSAAHEIAAGSEETLIDEHGVAPAHHCPRGKHVPLVGYVPQRHDIAWDFPLSVLDVVLMGRIRHIGYVRRAGKEDYLACMEALERTDMAAFADRTIGELSGGQRQRVLVARALAGQPRLLLLDEPFTGLDMPTQELLTQLFLDLAASGEAIMMSSHDIVASVNTCSRIMLFDGTIVGDDIPSRLQPSQWVQTFHVAQDNPLIQAVERISDRTHDKHTCADTSIEPAVRGI